MLMNTRIEKESLFPGTIMLLIGQSWECLNIGIPPTETPNMKRKELLYILAENKNEIKKRFNVNDLAVFGSVARNEMTSESDVDVLVSYSTTPGIFGFIELKQYLEEILHVPVDLVTEKALKKELRTQILEEAIYA